MSLKDLWQKWFPKKKRGMIVKFVAPEPWPDPPEDTTKYVPVISGGPEHSGLGLIAMGIIKSLKTEPQGWTINDYMPLRFYHHNGSGVRIAIYGDNGFDNRKGSIFSCEPEVAEYERGAIEQAVKEYDVGAKILRELKIQSDKKEQLERASNYFKNL